MSDTDRPEKPVAWLRIPAFLALIGAARQIAANLEALGDPFAECGRDLATMAERWEALADHLATAEEDRRRAAEAADDDITREYPERS